jgi:hypothetical protein
MHNFLLSKTSATQSTQRRLSWVSDELNYRPSWLQSFQAKTLFRITGFNDLWTGRTFTPLRLGATPVTSSLTLQYTHRWGKSFKYPYLTPVTLVCSLYLNSLHVLLLPGLLWHNKLTLSRTSSEKANLFIFQYVVQRKYRKRYYIFWQ